MQRRFCGEVLGFEKEGDTFGVWFKVDQQRIERDADIPGEGVNLYEPQSMLVFDFFAGIGGLSSA